MRRAGTFTSVQRRARARARDTFSNNRDDTFPPSPLERRNESRECKRPSRFFLRLLVADNGRARPLFERSEYTRNKLYRR